MSHHAMREARKTQRTTVDSSDDGYNGRPHKYNGVCQSDIIEVWTASNFLKDVEAVPLNNDL